MMDGDLPIGIAVLAMGIFLLFLIGLVTFALIPFQLIEYADGSTYGRMTTYESGLFYDRVWIRADYESSQTDTYCLDSRSPDREVLEHYIERGVRVKLTTTKYLMGWCSQPVRDVHIVGEEQ